MSPLISLADFCRACNCIDQNELPIPVENMNYHEKRPSILKRGGSAEFENLKLVAEEEGDSMVVENGAAVEIVFEDDSEGAEANNAKKVIFEEKPLGVTFKYTTPLRVSFVNSRVAALGVAEDFVVKTIARKDVTGPGMTPEKILRILEKATAGLPETGPMTDMSFEDKNGSVVEKRLMKNSLGFNCKVESSNMYEGGGIYKEKFTIKVHSVEHFAIAKGVRPKWILKSIDGRDLSDLTKDEISEIVEGINSQTFDASAMLDSTPVSECVSPSINHSASVSFAEFG